MDDTMRGFRNFAGLAFAVVALQGCGGAGGDPGAKSLPMGESCQTLRGQLNRLDSKGTQALVEKAGNGAKLGPAQQADVDSYNKLLNQYLGARCHV